MTSPSVQGHGGSFTALPSNHVSDDLLAAYAAGTLSEAESLLVATHAALCPTCRAAISEFEAVGASLLERARAGFDGCRCIGFSLGAP